MPNPIWTGIYSNAAGTTSTTITGVTFSATTGLSIDMSLFVGTHTFYVAGKLQNGYT